MTAAFMRGPVEYYITTHNTKHICQTMFSRLERHGGWADWLQHLLILPLTCSLAPSSVTHSLTDPLTHSFTHFLTHPLTYSLPDSVKALKITHSLIHSLACPFTRSTSNCQCAILYACACKGRLVSEGLELARLFLSDAVLIVLKQPKHSPKQ